MLKVMIADDEQLFRRALKVSIPWEELGYEVCCEADNGIDALDMISKFNPDVALIDINMPVMDGLKFSAEVKARGLNVIIVIITGYGEFNYVHQAIKYGVENYLLKPIDENELAKVLTSIRETKEKESAAQLQMELLKEQVQQYKPILKEMVLNDLLQGNDLRDKKDFKLKEYFSYDISSSYFQVAVIEIDESDDLGWNIEDRQIWGFAVSNITDEILSNRVPFEICRDIHNHINIIIYQSENDSNTKNEVFQLCERIRIAVSKYLKFTISVGIGNIVQDIGNLPLSYKEAIYSLKNKLVLGDNKVYTYETYNEHEININPYPLEQRKQLMINLRIGDSKGIEEILKSIFSKVRQINYSSEMTIVLCIELISTCCEFIAETGNTINCVLGLDKNILENIQEKKSLTELEEYISAVFAKTLEWAHGGKNKRSSKIVEETKTYIFENYSRFDLKIDDIAKHVHVNYKHLCFLFKKETGSTINDYITEIRIRKAKELTDEGEYSVSTLSSRVGYADANYFGKCFKKLYGLTPGKYIKDKTGQGPKF